MRFLKTNNKNWKRLCKGEVQAKQLEINLKEAVEDMTKEDEGKTVKVISVEPTDECRMIQVGDLGEIELYEYGMPCILLKTGLAKGSLYFMDESQLEVITNEI